MAYIVSPSLPKTYSAGVESKDTFDSVDEAREAVIKQLNNFPGIVYTIAEVVETVSASVSVTSNPVK